MVWLAILLTVIAVALTWIYRFYLLSFYIYLSAQFERRGKDLQLLSSLRENLVHERKKKIAGLEMILSSWEKGEEIQPRYEYFCDLLEQLKGLVRDERAKLMAITRDIWLWGKLWVMLLKIERISRDKREKSDVTALRGILVRFNELTDQVVQSATQRFSFSLNDAVRESVKTVRVEKTQASGISIEEALDNVGEDVRFSYDNFKQWQRLLTNLIRNAVEAVEAKQSGASSLGLAAAPTEAGPDGAEAVGADFPPKAGPAARDSLRGGDASFWVKVLTRESEREGGQAGMPDLPGVSVIIEDSGIGMDEATRASFFRKGFTSGKEHGLGLGVTEESLQFAEQYGNWQIESQKGVGTTIAINIDQEKARKGELILPREKPFYRTRLAFGFYFFLLILIGLALLFSFDKYSRFWVDWNPAYAKVEQGQQVYVFNARGKELWMHEFERLVGIRVDVPEARIPLIQIDDLDHDRWKEVLVVEGADSQTPAQLFCFDYKGNVKWVFTTIQDFPDIENTQTKASKPENLTIRSFQVDNFMNTDKKEIIVNSYQSASFRCQLVLLDHKGNTVGAYWHPGQLPHSLYTDLDEDGKKELVCAGINNRLNWRTVIFTLDPKELEGRQQGPPYYFFGNLKPAKEKKYVVLPHIKNVEWSWVEVSPHSTPQTLDLKPEGVFMILPDGRHYSLNKKLEYDYSFFASGFFDGWQEKTKFPFEIDLIKDSPNWENLEVYQNGVRAK